ncbi:hypothetical protein V6N13_113996 [Hibiscus sabdariffa]|uniref:Secreted protein n=1 Tax=Hibiscus sabdariffa TaxID=183260 RepID=A0ABR2U0H0_9ROSI
MLPTAVPRPWLAIFAGVVFAQHLLGWYAQVTSLCSVTSVCWRNACVTPRRHAGFACSLVGPCLRAPFYGLHVASSFAVALPFSKIVGPFSDARHAQALSLHHFVAGNSARHLPLTEVFLYVVQPLWPRFGGLFHTSAAPCSLCRRMLCDHCRSQFMCKGVTPCVVMRKGLRALGLVPYLRSAALSQAVLSHHGARSVHAPVCLANPSLGWTAGLSALAFAPCSQRARFLHIPVCLARPYLAWPEGLRAFSPAPCSQYAPLPQAGAFRYGACLPSPCLDRPVLRSCIFSLVNKLSWCARHLHWASSPFMHV